MSRWRKQNSENFELCFEEFQKVARQNKIALKRNRIGNSSSWHVMLNDDRGNRLADFWPSTMRVHLTAGDAWFFASAPQDVISAVLAAEPVGRAATQPGRPLEYDEASVEFRRIAGSF